MTRTAATPGGSSSRGGQSSLWLQCLIDGVAGLTVKARHAVYCEASPFQKIEVFDTYGYGRVLVLGGTIVLTESDEHVYHEMITHPAMLMHPAPARVCVVGGGDGGCVREVLKHKCVGEVTVFEIDALVKETVEKHFPALSAGFADPRTNVVIGDGAELLESSGESWDVIFVDSYDPGGPVQTLETASFFRSVADHLREGGIAVFQTDSPTVRPEVLRGTHAHVSAVFAATRPYLCTLPSFPGGTCSFLAATDAPEVLQRFDRDRYRASADRCRYYNDQVHEGAALLPRNVTDIVQG